MIGIEHSVGVVEGPNEFFPFFLQLSIGGFAPSSAVVLWSFTAPIAALMVEGTSSSINWFVAYAAILRLSGSSTPRSRSQHADKRA